MMTGDGLKDGIKSEKKLSLVSEGEIRRQA